MTYTFLVNFNNNAKSGNPTRYEAFIPIVRDYS